MIFFGNFPIKHTRLKAICINSTTRVLYTCSRVFPRRAAAGAMTVTSRWSDTTRMAFTMTTVRATTSIISPYFFLSPRSRASSNRGDTATSGRVPMTTRPRGGRVTSSPRSRTGRVRARARRDERAPTTTRNGGCVIISSIRSIARVGHRSRRVASRRGDREWVAKRRW